MSRRPRRQRRQEQSRGDRLVDQDRLLGQQVSHRLADLRGAQLAARGGGARRRRAPGRDVARAQRLRQRLEAQHRIVARLAQVVQRAAVRDEPALLAGIGEEGHRRAAVDQDQAVVLAKLHRREFGEIGDPLDRRQPRAAFQPGWKRLGQQRHVAVGGDPRGGRQPALAQRPPAQQQRRAPARPDRGRDPLDRGAAGCGGRRGARPGGGRAAFAPRHVGGQDQRRDLPRCGPGRRHRLDRVAAQVGGRGRGPHEPRRHVPRHRLDIRLQLRIVLHVPGGVVAHDVDDRHPRLAGVMQVRKPVPQAGTKMQQRRGGFPRHPRVAVGGPGRHALEQGQHRAHPRLAVQGRDEVHLAGAGVGEADLDARVGQGFHQGLRAVHPAVSPRLAILSPLPGSTGRRPWRS